MRRRAGAVLVAVVVAVALSGCGTQSPQQAMRQWLSQSRFATNELQLRSDAHHAASALRRPAESVAQLHTVCAVLLVETEAANASLPTPDAQLTTILAGAFNALGDGANECYRAGANQAKRVKAIHFLEVGVGGLAEGLSRAVVVAGN